MSVSVILLPFSISEEAHWRNAGVKEKPLVFLISVIWASLDKVCFYSSTSIHEALSSWHLQQ